MSRKQRKSASNLSNHCINQGVPGDAGHCINNPANSILLDSQSLAKIWNLITPILDEKAGNEDFFIVSGYSFHELKKDMKNLFIRIERNTRRVKHIIEGLQVR
jgi:hypothetical protein